MSIKLENCSFTYMAGTSLARRVLKDINLEIKPGELVALVGHTGSGKSTLAQLMNGLLTPDSGRVLVEEKNLQSQCGPGMVGMVFQYPEHQLFAETVYEDLAYGPRNKGLNQEQTDKAVRYAMEFVGLDFANFKDKNPLQLSGGQMRRVAIAGVVAMQPRYLIFDEPAAGLDPKGRHQVFQQILGLHSSGDLGIVVITHNMEEAVLADRLLVMDGGVILFDGSPKEFFGEHGQELGNLGLEEPELYQLCRLLQEGGLPLALPDTERALLKEIKAAKGWK